MLSIFGARDNSLRAERTLRHVHLYRGQSSWGGLLRRLNRADHCRRAADRSRQATGETLQAAATGRERGRVPSRPRGCAG